MSKPRIENTFWNWLDKAVGWMWDAQRHEDKYSVGIPDVSYGTQGINGWIELKAADKWPAKGLDYFSAEQANWLINRGVSGGHCFVVLKVQNVVLIFDYIVAHELRQPKTEDQLRKMAIKVWDNGFVPTEFIKILTARQI